MQKHRVRALLMGGQACVFYGAAEFSRNTDLAIVADAANIKRLRSALTELQAHAIAVPSCSLRFLRRGHAVHFRCQHPEALRMRVDVMSRMRGVDSFEVLWKRGVGILLIYMVLALKGVTLLTGGDPVKTSAASRKINFRKAGL